MINVVFSSCCLIFLSIVAVVYFSKKRMENIDNKIFTVMIIVNLIGILIDMIGYISFAKLSHTTLINRCIAKVYVIYFLTYVFCLFLYIYNLTFKNIAKNVKKMISALLVALLIIFLLPLNVHIEAKRAFSEGPCANFAYAVGIILLILMIIFLFIGRKKLKSYIPLLVFVGSTLLTAIIQKISPELTLMLLSNTIVTFIMYFTIENPDMKMIEQLELAKEQADKANRAKTEFLSSMSHEIRTPLNAIVGFSDFILNAESLDEAKENAKDIINASNTLLEIVNGILDISKIESGKLEIINSKYKAYDTFESLAKLIMPKMQEKGLDFTYYIAKDLPDTLYGDHANIKKVVTNLLSNAAKYTEKGFVRYEVNCVNDKDSTKLIISVEDSGRGIKKDNIDKLFNKFERLDEDRNTTIEGTGLGLAITKQLVELMNGKIVVHTIYGKGSKFTIILNQEITESIKEEKTSIQQIDNLALKSLKILIVDDNTLNLKVTKKILNRLGINNVECLESGFSCIDKIESGKYYDLILLDDMMPKMNGSETLARLKKIPGFNSITIALTANALTGMREKYLSNGFNGYLSKPIDKEALIKELKKTLIESNYIFTDTKETVNDKEEVEELVVDEKSNDYDLSYLKKNNIDIDRSIELLGNVETYNETLKDFMSKLQERFEKLQEYIKESNMPDYAISVHSLKSDCKYLGFTALANIAYEHEIKSKEDDLNFVANHFQELVTEKDKISTIAEQYLSKI